MGTTTFNIPFVLDLSDIDVEDSDYLDEGGNSIPLINGPLFLNQDGTLTTR